MIQTAAIGRSTGGQAVGGVAGVIATALASGSAWAQDGATAASFIPLLLVVLLAALLAAALRWIWRARRRIGAARDRAAGLSALLDAAPQPHCQWTSGGAVAASDGFRALLGLDRVDGFDAIEDALAPVDAAALRGAFDRLRDTGQDFVMTVGTADGLRRLRATGRRGGGGDHRLDVIWLDDVTAAEADAAATATRARAAEQAGAAAEQARAELAAILDALPLPVWIRGRDLRLRWANRAYLDAVDAPLETALAEQRELDAGDGGRRLAAQAQRGRGRAVENSHVVIAGERRLMEIAAVPVPTAAGGEGPVVGFALDVTPLEEARSELARHVAAHAEVLEQLKSAIAIFGPDKRIIFYNQSFVSLWGFDEGWLDTEPTLSELLEDQRERRRLPEYADFPAYKRSQNELFTSLIESEEDLMHLPDGTTLRSLVTPHPFGGLLFVQEDVTSALTLERSYNTLMAVQRESLDNLAEGIVVYGGDGRLRLSNPAFLRLWDLNPEDVAGNPHAAEVIDRTRRFYSNVEDWSSFRRELLASALERSETADRVERSDGSVLTVSTVPLPDGGVLNSYLDVTDSVRVEQALRASNAALEAADRLKSEFIANVSYQLRTPLNAIMGFAEILNNRYFGELNPRQIEYTESIIDASQRLLSLINDILDLATIEAGYMALDRKPVDVHQLLRSVQDLTREWAGKQSLKVTIDCPPSIGTLEADERRLKQALYNLISNAIKFTPPGGKITLSAHREGDEVSLIVSDTGIGIPEADQQRVFGRFEKAHPGSRHSGVGLGLSLVKSFVEMHGGRLALTSRPSEGTTVACILPAAGARPAGRMPAIGAAARR